MSEERKLKKKDIKPSDIKANIYDSVELIVDIHGVSRPDIDHVLKDLNKVLKAQEYSRKDDVLTDQEINDYGDRREPILSYASRRIYSETESVIRYYSKDDSEQITVGRLFLSIFLSYKKAHDLRANIRLLNKIVNVFNILEYFEVEKVFLVKKDSVYCSSLEKLYQCLDKKMFADVGYTMGSQTQEIDYGVTRTYNSFSYGDVGVVINKIITEGILSEIGEPIYEGKIETTVSMEPLEDVIDINEVLTELNKISFKVFMCHITDSFARDLVLGKSSKVRMGMNYNED